MGSGELGSRHLQGLSKIDKDVKITVVDPSSDSLELSQKRYKQMPSNSNIHSVRFYKTLPRIGDKVDLAIISTNADVRRKVIESLLDKVQVNYLILEKVVFQSIEDFDEIMQKLSARKIKAWVNCPRRLYPFFRKIRGETLLSNSIKISVKGGRWGLASNAIHMLDLLIFLSGQTKIDLDITKLDNEIYKSKRDGFIELGGKLKAVTIRGDILELIDSKKQRLPLKLTIEFNGKRLGIDQEQGKISVYINDILKSEEPSHIPLQSEITAYVVGEILENGNSNLTSLKESYLLHCSMINAFNQHLSTRLNKLVTICPIT